MPINYSKDQNDMFVFSLWVIVGVNFFLKRGSWRALIVSRNQSQCFFLANFTSKGLYDIDVIWSIIFDAATKLCIMWWSVCVCQRGLGRRGSEDWIRWPVSWLVNECYLTYVFWDWTQSSSRWRSTAQTTQSAIEPHSHLKTVLVLLNTYVH